MPRNSISRRSLIKAGTAAVASPYFGPGLLATLQLLALRDDSSFVEMFYMKRAGCLWRGGVDVDANGDVLLPQGPGIGYEPDRDVMEKFRVS